ncbi:MAG: SDR family oxidoreductase [Verrucomicrobia bacterium]|nr:SDR family oxidoreductase [Verrucomicrobiota bacterium]
MKASDCEGRVAIITGAARGMGAAIARLFAAHGFYLCLNDVDEVGIGSTKSQISSGGARVIRQAGSVASESSVKAMVQAAVREFGTVHILVNNAGVLKPTRVEKITEKEFDFVMNASAKGCFLCSREVIPHMKKQGWGRIVNISSSAGRSTSTLGGCHYTAAKAAMLGLTRAIAKEAGPFGITVNAVCPGLIDTEMVRHTISSGQIKRFEKSFPIPRLGKPEEVAKLALFLASDESAYITGASIDINGGDLMM